MLPGGEGSYILWDITSACFTSRNTRDSHMTTIQPGGGRNFFSNMLLCLSLCCAVSYVVGTRIVSVTADGDIFNVIDGNADNALAVATFENAVNETG